MYKDVEKLIQKMDSYLNTISSSKEQNEVCEVYNYITKQIKADIQSNILQFEAQNHELGALYDHYTKCTQMVIKFIVRCKTNYYYILLPLLSALMGFESATFKYANYHKHTSQKPISFRFVEQRFTNSHQTSQYGHGKRGKQHNPTPCGTSNFHLAAMDELFANFKYFQGMLHSKDKAKKIGIYDLSKLLFIFYHCSNYANLNVLNQYFGKNGVNFFQNICKWLSNLNDEDFNTPRGDGLSHFNHLFISLDDIFDKFMKTNANNKNKQIMQIKLDFVHKMLTCQSMNRRVQSLSLLKIILEKARSEDSNFKKNNEANAWQKSKKTKRRYSNYQQSQSQNNENNHQNHNKLATNPMRDFCCHYLLNGILDLLLSPTYIHENLLCLFQPIVDVLCECKKMDEKLVSKFWKASENAHSVVLKQFNALYLSMSRQLPTNVCKKFYDEIDQRFVYLKQSNKIEESHIEFVAQFCSNYADKHRKNIYQFCGIEFLKNYAIKLDDAVICNLELRKIAFDKLKILFQKQCMKQDIVQFLCETMKNMNDYIRKAQSSMDWCMDLTYVIEGIVDVLKTKQVGRGSDVRYADLADGMSHHHAVDVIDLIVDEVDYWFWKCSAADYDGSKNWKNRRKKELKLRFDFIKSIVEKTTRKISEQHVENLTNIPNKSCNDIKVVSDMKDIHHKQLKLWLDECVKLNRSKKILGKQAIKIVFEEQFDPSMDMTAFCSWLTYFHELNDDKFDIAKNEYFAHIPQHKPDMIGYDHIRKVIFESSEQEVIIAMVDELIQISLRQGPDTDDGVHAPSSVGVMRLFNNATDKIEEYFSKCSVHSNANGHSNVDIGSATAKKEIITIRHALICRRIVEYSIGKKWCSKLEKRKANGKSPKWCVVYRQRVRNRQRQNHNRGGPKQSTPKEKVVEVFASADTKMTQIRKIIKGKLNYNCNDRQLILYRKHKDNNFVMIEEQTLQYLTYADFGKKTNSQTMRIELEYEIRKNANDWYEEQRQYPSIARSFADRDQIKLFVQLLSSEVLTVQLSAYYFLRYLPMNGRTRFVDDLINRCSTQKKRFFNTGRPLLCIYCLETLHYFLALETVTSQENDSKRRRFTSCYSNNVYGTLLDFFLQCQQFNVEQSFHPMYNLLWIGMFNRLCSIFYDITGTDSKQRSYRMIDDYLHRSDEILHTLMHGMYVLLNVNIPSKQFYYFDITDPKNIENEIRQTILINFRLIIYIILHKNGKKNVNLEDIFLNGLKVAIKSSFKGKNKANYRMVIQDALQQGIEDFIFSKECNGNHYKFIPQILEIVMNTGICGVELLTKLIDADTKSTQKFIQPLLDDIFERLKRQNCGNKVTFSLLSHANSLYKLLSANNNDKQGRIEFLMNDCLFGSADEINENLLCKSGTAARREAFNLLFAMIDNNDEFVHIFLKLIRKQLHIANQNMQITDDDRFDFDNEEKKNNEPDRRNDFVGLTNLGCTCYLNSVLQQLYMIPSFTNQILSIESSTHHRNSSFKSLSTDGCLLYEFQRLLLFLRTSQKKYINPWHLLQTVRKVDGGPIDFYEQQDGSESLNKFISQLEEILKQTMDKNGGNYSTLLGDFFNITMRNLTKCENGHISAKDEVQTSLNIPVGDAINLEQGFDNLIKGMTLDHDNKYFCDECGEKVKAVRRETIYKPPKQFVITLGRFTWNWNTADREKINTRFEFEPTLDLRKYLSKNFTENDDDNFKNEDDNLYIYDIVGIVIHQGEANRGHYYSYIKDRSGKNEWFAFDDQSVCKKDYASIQNEAFGGSSNVSIKENNFERNRKSVWNNEKMNKQSVEIPSDRNAYILFYEQRAFKKEQNEWLKQEKPWQNVSYLVDESDNINKENLKLFRQQTLYDSCFVSFMKRLYSSQIADNNSESSKVLMRFVFNVVPVQIKQENELKWWWHRLEDRLDEKDIGDFIRSRLLPSYLLNIFGRFRNKMNRKYALCFFEHVVTKRLPVSGDLLQIFFEKLVIVIKKWEANILSGSDLSQIIGLIQCVLKRNDNLLKLKTNWSSLLDALRLLVLNDFEYADGLPSNIHKNVYDKLPKSESNLDIKSVFDLLLDLIKMRPKEAAKQLKGNEFLRKVICRDHCFSQRKIITEIVRLNGIKCFENVIEIIHFRMGWLDFYDVFGALNVFNELFANQNDDLLTQKLSTKCLQYHLDKILQNKHFYQLTKIEILLFAQLCSNNLVARSWVQDNCRLQIEQIGKWCQQNKKFNKNNRNGRRQNVKYYRYRPQFDGKDSKMKMQKWESWARRKVDKLQQLTDTQDLIVAFKKINQRLQ